MISIEFVMSESYIIPQNKNILSLPSTTTSSARTSSDENNSIISLSQPVKKVPDLEKQKYMEEIDTLLDKMKWMESTIETLENEKHKTTSMLMAKDLQLMDLRSNNIALREKVKQKLYKNRELICFNF